MGAILASPVLMALLLCETSAVTWSDNVLKSDRKSCAICRNSDVVARTSVKIVFSLGEFWLKSLKSSRVISLTWLLTMRESPSNCVIRLLTFKRVSWKRLSFACASSVKVLTVSPESTLNFSIVFPVSATTSRISLIASWIASWFAWRTSLAAVVSSMACVMPALVCSRSSKALTGSFPTIGRFAGFRDGFPMGPLSSAM